MKTTRSAATANRPVVAACARSRRQLSAPALVLRPISLAICLLGAGQASFALPQGAVSSAGQATVSVTAPGQMHIVQGTVKAGLDWTSFSIGAGESVNVAQPGRSSVLLNRVLGDDPSRIYGALTSNGSVWLINPRGIVFGANSRVDVGGLVASTLGLNGQSVADALATGRLQLGAGAGTPGALRAEGSITATDGSAVLVSPQLVQAGSINARRVGLAAASEVLVDVEGDGLIFFNVRNDRLASKLEQLGSVRADGGLAQISAAARAGFADTVLNVDGIVQARSLGVQQGRIVIDGGSSGITRVGGTLDATAATGGTGGTGGSVLVQGDKILLDAQAVLDASGTAGGGSVLVGGDFQGANTAVRNASMVSVRSGARLAAHALGQGDGGKVIVWSNDATRFFGAADARGGAHGGDGGLVEVSGKAYLDFRGTSDRSAPYGRAGLLLLDPGSLIIGITDDVDGAGGVLAGQTLGFAGGAALSYVSAGRVQTLLGSGNVSLQANDDIGVATAVNASAITNAGTATNLELRAGKLISIASGASIGVSGNLRLSANDPGGTPAGASLARVEVGAPLSAGGSITITNNGGSAVHQLGASLTAVSLLVTGNAAVSSQSVWTLSGATTLNGALGGSAALTKAGGGLLTLANAANGYAGPLTVNGGGLTLTGTLAASAISVNNSGSIFTAAAASRLGAGAALSVGSGATLALAADQSVASLSLAGTLSGAGFKLTTTGNAALLTGASLLTALEAGTLTSSGTNVQLTTAVTVAAGGTAQVTGGTLTVGDGTAAGTLTADRYTVASGATLAFNRSNNFTLGDIAGTGNLHQNGSDALSLNGDATQLTNIEVNAGSLVLLANAAPHLGTSANVSVSNATLTVNRAETIAALTLATGIVDGSSTLSTGTFASSGTSALRTTVDASTSATVTSGVLTVGNGLLAGALGGAAPAITLGNGAVLAYNRSNDITLGAITGLAATSTLRQLGSGQLQLGTAAGVRNIDVANGRLLLAAGNNDRLSNSGTVSVGSNARLTVNNAESIGTLALNGGTVAGIGTLAATTAFSSTGSSTLLTSVNATGATVQVTGGTLTLGDGTLAGGLTGAIALGNATLAYNAPGPLSIGAISGIGANRGTLQQDGAGELLLTGVVDVAALRANRGTLATQSAGLVIGTPTLTINNAIFRLGAAASVGALTLAGGTVGGTGTLSAASLTSSGTSTLLADVLLAANAQVSGGALVIGGGAGSNTGSLNFSAPGNAVQLGNNSALRFDRTGSFGVGDVTGTGSTALVLQQGSLTLNGDATTVSNVTVNGGTLNLAAGSGNRIGNAATLTVGSGATLALDNNNETVGTLVLAGNLTGSRTLTATDYTLQSGAVIDALLGTGTLHSTGSVALNGTALANAVFVDSGSLTLAAAGGRLAGAPPVSVTVADGAALAVGGIETISTLNLAGTVIGAGTLNTGVLSSSGANAQIFTTVAATTSATVQAAGTLTVGNGADGNLTAGSVTLAAANSKLVIDHSVARALNNVAGPGTLEKRGTGTLSLNGSANALGTLDVVAGNLALTDAAGTQVGNSTAVTVRSAGTLTTASGDETVGTLSLAGMLAGTGTLRTTASTTLLVGSTVDSGVTLAGADITISGAGTHTINGSTTGSTAITVDQTATLVLGAASNLSDNGNVSVLAGSRLTLGANDTIHKLTLAGTLDAPANFTLSTADTPTGGATLQGSALVDTSATLAGGMVQVTGAAVQLNGKIDSAELAIANGALLTLGPAERLIDSIHVDIAGGGTLYLNFAETIGSLTGAGTVTGPGALSTASFTLNGQVFNVLNTLTTGALTSTGNSRVEGSLHVTGDAAVASGTLTVGNAAGTAGTLDVDGITTVAQDATLAYRRNTLVTLGAIVGAGTLLQQGSGELQLGRILADNVALPFIQVEHGVLSLAAGNNDRLSNTNVRVSVGSDGTFRLDNSGEAIDRLVSSGTIAGTGTLTAHDYLLSAGNVNAPLGGGTLLVDGAVTLNAASGANAISVSTNSGALTLTTNASLAATADLSVANASTLTLAKDFTVATLVNGGHLATSGGTYTLTATGGSQLTAGALVDANLAGGPLTVTGDSTLNGRALLTGADATAHITGGTLTLGSGADRLGGIAVTVDEGTFLALTSSQSIASLTLAGTLTGNPQTLTAATYTLLDHAVVDAALGAGALISDGSVRLDRTAGVDTVAVHTGTLTLNGSDLLNNPNAAVSVASAGQLALGGDTTVRSLDLRGTLSGTGRTLTALTATLEGAIVGANLGAGTLDVNGATSAVVSTLTGTSGADAVHVNGGTLALASAGSLTNAAVAATVDGTLQLGGDQSLATLDGSGAVELGIATLTAGGGSFGGTLAGSGGLVKQGSGTLTLAGDSSYSGRTTVSGGMLVVGGTLASADLRVDGGALTLTADERLADAATVTVATGAAFNLDHQEHIASLALSGMLNGSGRLTADTVALDGGTVNANLGNGSLTSLGASVLNGSSAADTVAVNGGTLTLAGADRLTGTPAITVAALATLMLGGDQTASGLQLLGNLLASAGSPGATLTAATYTFMQDALAAANLGSGALTVSGSSTLSGQAAVDSVHVTAGSFTLASANRLTAAPTVLVDGGSAGLVYTGDQAMGALTLIGTLQGDGAGTVHSSSTTLAGGTVAASARLGSAATAVTASSTLAGTSAAATVDIAAGATLTLTAADRLADTATVTVADTATLRLTGNDTIGRLNLAGRLDAAVGTPSTLTAGLVALDGGDVLTALGAGTLTSRGSSTLNASTGATSVTVTDGTLTLLASNLLDNTAAVDVRSGALLELGSHSDTVASLALAGTLNGSGTLTATTYALDSGTVNANLGGGTLASVGSSVLNGRSAAGTLNVDGGSLVLAAGSLTQPAVTTLASGATLVLGGDLTLGSLAGSGDVALGAFTLTTGSIGASSYGGVLSGSGGLRKDGSSSFTLTGASVYGGDTTVLQGTLATTSANLLPDGSAVDVRSGATLRIGGNDTVASLLLAGTLDSVAGSNAKLTASTTTLQSGIANANLGIGTLLSHGASTLNGTSDASVVRVIDGRLTLGSADRLDDNAAVTVLQNAELYLNGDDRVGSIDLAGTVGGTGVLSAANYALSGGIYNLDLGGGTLTSTGASQLNGHSAATAVFVNGGTLTLNGADRFSAAPGVTVADGAALHLRGGEVFGWLAGAGTVDLGDNTVLRTGSLGDSNFAGALTGALTAGLTKTGDSIFTLAGLGSYGGATRVEAGTLATNGANLLSDASAVTVVSGATLRLGGSDTVASLTLAGTLNPGSTNNPPITLTASSVTLDSGTVNADLATTTLTSSGASSLNGKAHARTITVTGDTLALGAADRLDDDAAITVNRGAALALGGDDTVGSLALLGRLHGSGTLNAAAVALDGGSADANLGGGSLTSTGASQLNGTSGAVGVTVTGGVLTLGGGQRLTAAPAVDVQAGAQLLLAGDQTAGLLRGAGSVDLGSFMLTTGSAGDSSFGGVLSGSGGLVKQGDGTRFTLTGDNVYSGATRVEGGTLAVAGRLLSTPITVNAGTLALAAADRLDDSANVVVARGARFTLAGNERVATLDLAGTLGGSGTLDAATVDLRGGTVDANLGSGTLTSRGNSTLIGSVGATRVSVLEDTLTLQGDTRLTALPAVDVAPSAMLRFGGAQAFGSLAGNGTVDLGMFTLTTGTLASSVFGGVLQGSGGGLVKRGSFTFRLDGDNSYSGSTRIEGGVLQVAGTLASTVVDATAGTLALASADRLADGATVTVGDATFTLAGDEHIGSLVLTGGTLGGSGTLTATTYMLTGATVDAALGSGTLVSSGTTRLNGTAGAGSVTVADGNLMLGSADRLDDNAVVAVQRSGRLTLNGNDTVATLTVAGALARAAGVSSTLNAGSVALDGGTVDANLGGGTLVSSGSSTLHGSSAATNVLVNAGTLTLGAAQRLTALPAVSVNNGATLAMAGDQAFGNLAGAGNLGLGSFTLTTGAGGAGDSIFAGAISGSGGLIKQGTSVFTLSGANTYSGTTAVRSGTLRIGNGGSSGSVDNTSAFVVDGTLSFARSDNVALPQAVSGSGMLEQAGSGRLLLSGASKTYTGRTLVNAGELATSGADMLADSTAVEVEAGARLRLGGRETLRSLDADGAVALAGDLAASGDLLLRGAVTVDGNQTIALSGQRIDAVNDGNVWGSSLAINAGGLLTLSSGRSVGAAPGTGHHALVLGTLSAAAGGRIDAGLTTLSAVTTLTGGTLELVSSATRTTVAPGRELSGKLAGSLPIAYISDAVLQGADSRISVAAGAELQITSSNGGSVQLMRADNSFVGTLAVLSGAANSPWAINPTPDDARQSFSLQSRVRINGTTVNIGGAGIEADVVSIRADQLATVGPAATIVARLPFDSSVGTAVSLPGLTLELTPVSFNTPFPFGGSGAGNSLRVNVGSRAWGNRTLPLDAGYVTVLPRGGAQGSTAVLLQGPAVNVSGGYRFFFDGAGRQGEIPVFYNGVLPTTPQVENSISATVAVSEGARKELFEEAIRTENVAVRLRAGVIAEVGPAPSATQGAEGVRVPATCPPVGNTLLCPVPEGPAARPAERAAP